MYCNAIDDALMGVTHVLRGDDHLTNSPRQILILQALELPVPQYCHMALITGSDGSPLSKRHGSKSIGELRDEGYLSQGLVNYLSRLGHHYENPEYMDRKTLAKEFKLIALSRSPARFDKQQLCHWQKEALLRLSTDELWKWLREDTRELISKEQRKLFLETIQPNVVFPDDVHEWAKILLTDPLEYTQEQVDILSQTSGKLFTALIEAVEHYGTDYSAIIGHIKKVAAVKGKSLFQPLRILLTAQTEGPELKKLLQLLGETRIKQRAQLMLDSIA